MPRDLEPLLPGERGMSRNLQTALLLAFVALTTFFGIIAKYWILNG